MSDKQHQATLTLIEGPDGIHMEVDYFGNIDPDSIAHNTITHLAGMLIESAEKIRMENNGL